MNQRQANRFVKWIEEIRVLKDENWSGLDYCNPRAFDPGDPMESPTNFTFCAVGRLPFLFDYFKFDCSPVGSLVVHENVGRFFGLTGDQVWDLEFSTADLTRKQWVGLATKVLHSHGWESVPA